MIILDHEKEIYAYQAALKQLEDQKIAGAIWEKSQLDALQEQLQTAKEKVYTNLTPIERVAICRHPQRPKSLDYIKHVFSSFEQLHGDRLFKDDSSIVCGIAYLDNHPCMIVAQEKGDSTEERLHRNFGMSYPEGYRKALRVMKLAEKFRLPVISFIDTPGAYPGLEAEERGQGWAIANNLKQMSCLKTPLIALLIGEGCSGGALGIGVCDRVLMLEHAYYSVISPEGCASILWKDTSSKKLAAQQLKLNAEYLIEFGIVDKMLKEPQGGAHYNPRIMFDLVKKALLQELVWALQEPLESLLEMRYQKYRKIGFFYRN